MLVHIFSMGTSIVCPEGSWGFVNAWLEAAVPLSKDICSDSVKSAGKIRLASLFFYGNSSVGFSMKMGKGMIRLEIK